MSSKKVIRVTPETMSLVRAAAALELVAISDYAGKVLRKHARATIYKHTAHADGSEAEV